ncbi:hypothetical protein D1007_11563 [Hordeum vulgare]|nr:hypothetical protein D1007_11563 [Hordeum vulgare]
MAVVEGRHTLEPALGRSTVLNRKGLDKILPMVTADSNEWGPTKILPASTPLAEIFATSAALHFRALFSDCFPHSSEFFNVVLVHYEIHALHLDLRFVLLLSSFTFFYVVCMGDPPSVALFRHFFSLWLTALDQRYMCVFFRAVDGTASECINMRMNRIGEGFRQQWVYVDVGHYRPYY